MRRLEITKELLARNAVMNFIAATVPAAIGLITVPVLVEGLGTERFGLLSAAWLILGYFTVFDLGLGRATTRYVADALGQGRDDEVPRVAWTAITVQAAFGTMGALVLIAMAPVIVKQWFNISLGLLAEAEGTLRVVALGIPICMVATSFSGVLEARQRFELVNAVRIPAGASSFLLPLVGLLMGARLPAIVGLVLLSRLAALAAMAALVLRVFPHLGRFSPSATLLATLLGYGSWIMVSTVVSPVLEYLDRFIVALLLSMSAVAYYSAPYDAVNRLLIIPVSLVMVVFPAFTALKGMGSQRRLEELFARSVKYILLSVGPVVAMVVLFAKEVLETWLGGDFASQSTAVVQLLAMGVLINSVARVPVALLQGIGRPDVIGKLHMIELPFYIGLAWTLVSRFGIVGAGAAWTCRIAADGFLLFVFAHRVGSLSARSLASDGSARACLALVTFVGLVCALRTLGSGLSVLVQGGLLIATLGLFGWVVWRNALDITDRQLVFTVGKALRLPWSPS